MNYSKQSSLICFIDAPCDNYIEVVLGHLIKSLKVILYQSKAIF